MNWKIVIVTGPTVEPVSVADVKSYLHVDYDDEDTIIASWIKSARLAAEGFMRTAFNTQTIDLIMDWYPPAQYMLPRSPVQSVTSIKYTDTDGTETTLDSGEYNVDLSSIPAAIALTYGNTWPTTTLKTLAGFVTRYVAGYGDDAEDVPEYVKDAIMLYCGWRNENRAGEIEKPPAAFYSLLMPYRQHLDNCLSGR